MGIFRSRRCYLEKARRFEKAIMDFLELPADAALDLPCLTLIGNNRLVLENHRGIHEYRPEYVCIRLAQGDLEITGEDMFLREIKPDLLTLEGTVHSIRYGGLS